MYSQSRKIELIRALLKSLSSEDRNVIRIARDLCLLSAKLKQVECFADENALLHVVIDGKERFQFSVEGGKGNFRNLLAVMYGFAKQFADRSVECELSPYRVNCVLNLDEFDGEGRVVLQTRNTTSDQSFLLLRI